MKLLTPPSIVEYVSGSIGMNIDAPSKEWMQLLPKAFSSFNTPFGKNILQGYNDNWDGLMAYVEIVSNKLLQRLYGYLKNRYPLYKVDLMPGRHWVWDSFRSKVKKITAVMIFNGHIVPHDSMKYRTAEDVLLNDVMVFDPIDVMQQEGDYDGSYLVVDKVRNIPILALSTDEGIGAAYWKHKQESMLEQANYRRKKLCYTYPHEESTHLDTLLEGEVKGKFSDLSMRIGIKVNKDNMSDFINLFIWNEKECEELDKLVLKGQRQYLDCKKYKHILNMFEVAYNLAIEPSKNLSAEAACSWQTGYPV